MKTALPLVPLLALVAFAFVGCEVFQDFYSYHGAGSSTGSTGTGGTGGAGVCVPGSMMACYDGPAGTEGVGLCKAGSKTCAANGASFEPCMGAILPVTENCATPVDEDCDGLAPSCQGVLSWAKRFGEMNNQAPNGIAVDEPGNVGLVGSFRGAVDLGGGLLQSASEADVFVAKLDASGNHLWSKHFGDASSTQGAGAVAVDAMGSMLVAGFFVGSVDFGGGPQASTGSFDAFVAKLDVKGKYLWSKSFGSVNTSAGAGAVAVDGAGNIVLAGTFIGAVDLGGGQLKSGSGSDVFIAKLDANGKHLWSKNFGAVDSLSPLGVAVDGSGNIVLAGSFSGALDLGGTPLASVGDDDVFLVKLDGNGNHKWSTSFGDANKQLAGAVGVDEVGNIALSGTFRGTLNLGGK